jgi:hypothetical protein
LVIQQSHSATNNATSSFNRTLHTTTHFIIQQCCSAT